MIKDTDLLKAIGIYAEKDMLPVVPDKGMKAAIVAFIAATAIRPDYILKIIKNALPQMAFIVEDGGMIDIDSLGAIVQEYLKHQKNISVRIPMTDKKIDLDSEEISKLMSYAKQFEGDDAE